MYAKVVVDIKSNNLNESFEYQIPKDLEEFVYIGSRVKVSFGMQEVLGFVIEINEHTEFIGTVKDIKEVYTYEKELNSDQISLARYLSDELNAPLVKTLDLMTPSFLKEQKKKYLHIENYDLLHPDLALLFRGKKKILIDKSILENKLIKKEIEKNNIRIEYDFLTYGKNKKDKLYSVINELKVNSKIRALVVEYLRSYPNSKEDEIRLATNVSLDTLNKMVKDNTLKVDLITRLDTLSNEVINASKYSFNFDQSQLIEKYYESGLKPYLLFTKNEEFKNNFIYKLIYDLNKKNKKVAIFASNIMAVESMSLLLKKNLKGLNVLTYHSKNTNADNYDTFMNIKYNNYDCLVSTSIGIFLPFTDIDLFIILDEESQNYIYEFYPYYDARHVLEYRSKELKSKIIFSSSSPSIYAFYQQRLNNFYLLEDDVNQKGDVVIVDMKEEILEENNAIISKELNLRIKKALSEKKMSMLIINNKAFSTLIRCRECGKVLKCPKCKIPLVHLKQKNIAKCNYCEYKTENYKKCECGSENIISLGFGLEQVKHKLSMAYPLARILQVDSDNVSSLDDYAEVLSSIEDGNVDIIIGTNALINTIKDNVSVVGLLYVDSFLNINDYRGSEYTYNLISKMTNFESLVIQTYNKNHFAIKNAALNNYEAYYTQEIANRELLNYEPFFEMNVITITGPFDKLFHFGYYYRKAVSRLIGDNILGPSYDYKLKGVKLIVKHNRHQDVVRILNDAIRNFNDKDLLVTYIRYQKGM